MARNLAKLLDTLEPDPWRQDVGFTDDITETNKVLFGSSDDAGATAAISDWLARYQPCLFGRMAAKAGLISYCIIRESEFCAGPSTVREKIQDVRTEWTRLGYEGKKSAFVILLISPRLAVATPNTAVLEIAQALCSGYLLRDVAPDEIYHDELFLEKPGTKRTTWKWLAGVNYFCAQGDRRWWHDHRIPGGMAFSINSVGHLVKSGQLSEALKYLDAVLGGSAESQNNERLTSLGKALDLAMRTIAMAAETPSGHATRLVPLEQRAAEDLPPCPIALPKSLMGKDYTQYEGSYHTDITLPSEYFRPDIERAAARSSFRLDFTYLFHDDVDNPDHTTMGKGRRVRADGPKERDSRLYRMVAKSVRIKDSRRLEQALRNQE